MEVAELVLETFTPRVGEPFRMGHATPRDLVLTLVEARPLAGGTSPPGAFRAPFRLLFHGPATPAHPQSIVPLDNAVLGRIEIFLVPIGPDTTSGGAGAMRYEAIFT